MRGIPNTIVDEASKYVQTHARYHPESPTKPYVVRYHGRTLAFCAKDTWKLVEQLARFLNKQRRVK